MFCHTSHKCSAFGPVWEWITITSGIYPLAYSLTSDRIGPKIKKAIRNLLMIPAVGPRRFISILPPALV